MATKRRPIQRNRMGSEAEYAAWRDVFATGFDFFGDLEEFGVVDPTSRIIPVAEMPKSRAAFRSATADAWRRHGPRFMLEWEQPDNGPWAVEEFGAP